MSRPCRFTIDPDQLRGNLDVLRRLCRAARVWAVSKAWGYGHGLEATVSGFAAADGLAVIEPEEVERARQLGWLKPMAMLEGPFFRDEIEPLWALQTELAAHRLDQVDWMLRAAEGLPANTAVPRVWIKLNTGMNRLGIDAAEDTLLAPRVAALRARGIPLGWMSHLAKGESLDDCSLPRALLLSRAQALGRPLNEPLSLANSAASLLMPIAHLDWIRPGILLYGGSPLDAVPPKHDAAALAALDLKAASRLSTQLIATRWIEKGAAVGYGQRFVARRRMRIGTAAIGYADGYPRNAPDGTPVWVSGRRVPLIGRVSMDMITVDLSQQPGAEVGNTVVAWGPELPADEVAHACGTIAYELFTGVTPRVHRLHATLYPS